MNLIAPTLNSFIFSYCIPSLRPCSSLPRAAPAQHSDELDLYESIYAPPFAATKLAWVPTALSKHNAEASPVHLFKKMSEYANAMTPETEMIANNSSRRSSHPSR